MTKPPPLTFKGPFPGEAVDKHLKAFGHLPVKGCCKPMKNLSIREQIEAAEKIGYFATFAVDAVEDVMVSIHENGFLGQSGKGYKFAMLSYTGFEITGWKYAGELAGNKIPKGQKFRVKETGEVFDDWQTSNGNIDRIDSYDVSGKILTPFHKSEIEPVF